MIPLEAMFSLSGFRVARLATLTTIAVVALASSSACVQDQDYLVVNRAVWFPDPDSCALTGSEDTPLAMTADVKFDSPIAMAFSIDNNLVENQQSNTGIDDTEVRIESAEVKLSFSGGAVSGSEFEVTLPSNTIAGGESIPFLIQIPTSVTQSLRATMQSLPEGTIEFLEMEVVFKGRRTGQAGKSKLGVVKTAPYVYPFEICYGCLEVCTCTCPTATEWTGGSCGFAQGLSVTHPSCSETTP